MICILELEKFPTGAERGITGWLIGTDTHDVRRQAEAHNQLWLANILYAMDFVQPGKHVLASGHIMLVS